MNDSPTPAAFPFDRWSMYLFVAGLIPLVVAGMASAISVVPDSTAERVARVSMIGGIWLAIVLDLGRRFRRHWSAVRSGTRWTRLWFDCAVGPSPFVLTECSHLRASLRP